MNRPLDDLIASGVITRERACDGKKAFRTPGFAERKAAQMTKKFGVQTKHYHCVFCLQYHLATEHRRES